MAPWNTSKLCRYQTNGSPVLPLTHGVLFPQAIVSETPLFPSLTHSDTNEGEGTLAYGASDGSVGLIKVSQRLKQSDVLAFTPQFDIEVAMESTPRLVYQADGNACTMLTWVPIPGRSVSR